MTSSFGTKYKILKTFLTLLFCSHFLIAQEDSFHETDLGDYMDDIHNYLDTLLREATDNFQQNKLDPISLPDTLKGFRKKVAFVTFSGGLHTYNGTLQGLSSLHRTGEVRVTFDQGDQATVEADLAFDDLNIRTDARIWFGKLGKRFSMAAKVKYLRGTVNMEIPLSPGGQPKVTSLLIRKIGKITLDFKRLGPLNWILEGFGFVFLNTVKKFMRECTERIILEAVNKEMSKVELPALMARIVEN